MSTSDSLKLTVWAAVHEIEHTLAPVYPQRFRNIDAAKEYIMKLCDNAKYHYTRPHNYSGDSQTIVRMIKERTCFLVAIRAHDQGEFYLNEALPDRESLRAAVESNIAQLLPLLCTWPTDFATADVAAKYVAGFCALTKLPDMRFEGVAEHKFRRYVTWNTARRAWEQGRFELNVVPRDWRRKEKSAVPATMTDAIESDIIRLKSLIRTWPSTFVDLNAARNFVGQWCYDHGFRYTGWRDVELHKFRLYVNFNAAKYALQAGLFKVGRAIPKRAPAGSIGSREKDGSQRQEDEVKVIEIRVTTTRDAERADANDSTDRPQDAQSEHSDSSDSNTNSDRSFVYSPSVNTDSVDSDRVQTPDGLQVQEPATTDPFKDLVAELQRGYILKAAFE